jgi:hypothetical protein
MKFLGAFLLALAAAVAANAQCLDGCCSGRCPPPAAGPAYQWVAYAADPDHVYLFLNGAEVGGYSHLSHVYRAYNGAWSEPTAAPVALPAARCGCPRPFTGACVGGCNTGACRCQ